jgi:hypothetical protein
MSSISGPDIVTDGLVVNLDASSRNSYPGSGTAWLDRSGNGNNGTLVGGATYSNTIRGEILFNGTDAYCNVPLPSVQSYNTITVCGFIKWVSFNSGMFLGMTNYDIWTANNCLGYNNAASNVIGINAATVTSLGLLGNWKFYTFVMNKTGLLTTNKIYINGVSVGLLTAVYNADGNIPGFDTNLRLCSWNNTGYHGNLAYGNVSIYSRELTPQEILQNYNVTKSRFGL